MILLDFNFRHLKSSQDLMEYVAERFHKLARFRKTQIMATVTFSSQKKSNQVAVHLKGSHIDLHASAEGEDFFACVDSVAEKLERQLSKTRAKTKESRRKAG